MAAEGGAKLLIVEDHDDVRQMLGSFLGSKGFAVTGTGSAAEGVAAARATRPDLIIMDLGLPDVDGLSAVRALRSAADTAGVPVLVVSAYDTMQFRAEAMEAGCAGYLVKPVDPEKLLETVRLLIGPGGLNRGAGEGR